MKRFFLSLVMITLAALIYSQERHIVVAADGSGEFTSVQEAVNSIRAYMSDRTYLFIKNGIYREKIVIPSWVTNLTMTGESVENTVITWNDHAKINNMGTFRTYTIWVQGVGFTAENITFENNAGQLGQAVAVHVDGDRAIFRNCRLLGNQDTLLTANQESRQYYENCYIEGTTDFIFGPATAWFENCEIHSKKEFICYCCIYSSGAGIRLYFQPVQAYVCRRDYKGIPGASVATLCSNCISQLRTGKPHRSGRMAQLGQPAE